MSTVEISNIVAGWQDWDGAQAQVYLFSSQHSELLEIKFIFIKLASWWEIKCILEGFKNICQHRKTFTQSENAK